MFTPLQIYMYLLYGGQGAVGQISGKEATYGSKTCTKIYHIIQTCRFFFVFFFVLENTQNVFMLSPFAHKLAVTCFFPGSTRQFRLLYVTPRGELWGSFSLGLSEHTSSNKYTSYICVSVCVCVCMADSKPTL